MKNELSDCDTRTKVSDMGVNVLPSKPRDNNSAASINDYRYEAKRKNLPPAGIASQGSVKLAPPLRFEYNPHLPPVLRFDASGKPDRLTATSTSSSTQLTMMKRSQTF